MEPEQRQVLEFFRRHSLEWNEKSQGKSHYVKIQERNSRVLTTIASMESVSRFLDLGCGTGQLVIEAARRGIPYSEGIDFAAEMIATSVSNANCAAVNAHFVHASIFEAELSPGYDVISAQGQLSISRLRMSTDSFITSMHF